MEKLEKKINDLVIKLNTVENIDKMNIPILDDFKVLRNEITKDSNVILVAKKDNTIEQFLTEGTIPEEVSIDEKVDEVISNIDRQIRNNPLYKNRQYMKFYKEYDNGTFKFLIYIQDILTGTKKSTSFVRQANAYFIEPNGREFCQVSIAAGRYAKSEETPIIDEIKDIENDKITTILIKNLYLILDNLKYK